MQGTGVALVTPFTPDGDLDEAALTALVGELEARGVDFVVPCGTTGEAPLLSADEQARVVQLVADAASVPVLAGTGQPGLRRTVRATVRAASAGADAALVVTPYYYAHDQDALAAYYRELADEVDLPVYAYSIPSHAGIAIEPGTAAELAAHPNIAGLKDSSGDLDALQDAVARTDGEPFEVLIGHGGLYAHGLEMGAAGGILALADVAPERASAVYDRHAAGEPAAARRINRELAALDRAVTARYGIPGLKAAMRMRDLPGGYARAPHRPVGSEAEAELERLVTAAEPGE
ncbi:MAG: dihydrodipicolinate synthase family protein [Halobacteriales archaeon]